VSDHHSDSLINRSYLITFFALIGLTILTVLVAYKDMGAMNAVVALLIASVKAGLVLVFFMHVGASSTITRVWIAASVFWLALLLVLTLNDYFTRPLVG